LREVGQHDENQIAAWKRAKREKKGHKVDEGGGVREGHAWRGADQGGRSTTKKSAYLGTESHEKERKTVGAGLRELVFEGGVGVEGRVRRTKNGPRGKMLLKAPEEDPARKRLELCRS